jgi:hypothetical protein
MRRLGEREWEQEVMKMEEQVGCFEVIEKKKKRRRREGAFLGLQ